MAKIIQTQRGGEIPKYNSAPLPFMGQKRRFVNHFREALREFSSATTFVDLFGGSGLLSHITARERPDARVIYNDFDDYHIRIENVERTNAILAQIREILASIPRMAKVPADAKAQIVALLEEHEQTGFVDYITISSSILFSSHYATDLGMLQKESFYNRVKQTDYVCNAYLAGLEIVKYDYRELFDRHKQTPGVVFLVDPPYLSTQAGHYDNYWALSHYLDVLRVIDGHAYIYFTSNKSQIVELIDWIQSNSIVGNPFAGVMRKEYNTNPNYHAQYTDIMLYRA
jgi:hypothetical protein|nr:MAG TPA: DNA adenine methylase [Caudoviricetes sp.]DAS26248.1 MAG TPA: DNA adenine methylase [Caudoviricetes sp.]